MDALLFQTVLVQTQTQCNQCTNIGFNDLKVASLKVTIFLQCSEIGNGNKMKFPHFIVSHTNNLGERTLTTTMFISFAHEFVWFD